MGKALLGIVSKGGDNYLLYHVVIHNEGDTFSNCHDSEVKSSMSDIHFDFCPASERVGQVLPYCLVRYSTCGICRTQGILRVINQTNILF